MPELRTVFVTRIYRATVDDTLVSLDEMEATCRSLAQDDEAGQAWCRRTGYPGYTSYASLDDLPWRYPVFKSLARNLAVAAAAFAKQLDFELKGRRPRLDGLWVNILPQGGVHTAHIHPRSVISGTYYVTVPEGASGIKFEDPRLGLMMAAPPRKAKASPDQQPFVYESPQAGTLLMWESWLRHEVPLNHAEADRISVSFNFSWP